MPSDAERTSLRDRLRARFPHLPEADLQRVEGDNTSLLAFLDEQGLGHSEALLHFEEFMETEGQTVAPTMDPPSHAGPADAHGMKESSDNPG